MPEWPKCLCGRKLEFAPCACGFDFQQHRPAPNPKPTACTCGLASCGVCAPRGPSVTKHVDGCLCFYCQANRSRPAGGERDAGDEDAFADGKRARAEVGGQLGVYIVKVSFRDGTDSVVRRVVARTAGKAIDAALDTIQPPVGIVSVSYDGKIDAIT